MCGVAREQGTRGGAVELPLKPLATLETQQTEARHQQRVPRYPNRTQYVGEKCFMPLDKGCQQLHPPRPIPAEYSAHVPKSPREHYRRSIVKGMRERRRRRQPPHAVIGQTKAVEDGRYDAHRMDRGTHVVVVARERQRFCAAAAANRAASLQDFNREASSGQDDRGGEPVRTGADDYRVERWPAHERLVCSHRAPSVTIAPATHTAKSVLPITGRRLPWMVAASFVGENRLPSVMGCRPTR